MHSQQREFRCTIHPSLFLRFLVTRVIFTPFPPVTLLRLFSSLLSGSLREEEEGEGKTSQALKSFSLPVSRSPTILLLQRQTLHQDARSEYRQEAGEEEREKRLHVTIFVAKGRDSGVRDVRIGVAPGARNRCSIHTSSVTRRHCMKWRSEIRKSSRSLSQQLRHHNKSQCVCVVYTESRCCKSLPSCASIIHLPALIPTDFPQSSECSYC